MSNAGSVVQRITNVEIIVIVFWHKTTDAECHNQKRLAEQSRHYKDSFFSIRTGRTPIHPLKQAAWGKRLFFTLSMLERHMGMLGNLWRALTSVHWPGLTSCQPRASLPTDNPMKTPAVEPLVSSLRCSLSTFTKNGPG